MKVLVIGSGGREHALVWKLAQSKNVEKIYAAPGNGGTATELKSENLNLNGFDPASMEGQKLLLEFAQKEKIDLTVVGPEAPLAAGIVDSFRTAGFAIAGPGKKEAMLESSKLYSKSFMVKYGVRTAMSKGFTNLEAAIEYADKHFIKGQKKGGKDSDSAPPLVIKADGLAAGKGVVIAEGVEDAKKTLKSFMKEGTLGEAGEKVIMEEFLKGREVSILAAVSVAPGKKGVIKPFISARDHKRLLEGGMGSNTGGMGAIAPVPDFTVELYKDFEKNILAPTLKGMEAEKMDYRGFIFFGILIQEGSCYLLEYNARLGDPETQAVLPLMDFDFAELCVSIMDGTLKDFSAKWKKGAVCAPVAVSQGYPGSYKKGIPIAINNTGFKRTSAVLFAAGAERGVGGFLGSGLRTLGGRVLAVSAYGSNAEEAYEKAYNALRFIDFEGMTYRRDIGNE